jgi:Spy/CpxP family protein refolding chaperone
MWALLAGAGMLVGGVTFQAVAADDGAQPAARKLAGTPLGKLITGRIGRLMVLRSELNLTDEQKAALRTTLKAHRREIAAAVRPLVEKRHALRDAVLADKSDEEIRAAAADLGKAIGDAAVKGKKLHALLKDKVHLTDEQVSKIKAFRAGNDAAVESFLEKESSGSKP